MVYSCSYTDSQSDKLSGSEIREYVETVDADRTFAEETTPGFIEYNGQTGNVETQSLFDRETKMLYRIRYYEITDTTLNLTFYYRSSKPVYSKVEKWHWDENEYKSNSEREVHYSEGQVIFDEGNGIKPTELYRIGMNFLRAHNDYYGLE